jgi:hypothetical protein
MAVPGSILTNSLSFDAEGGEWVIANVWFILKAPDYSLFEAAGMRAMSDVLIVHFVTRLVGI